MSRPMGLKRCPCCASKGPIWWLRTKWPEHGRDARLGKMVSQKKHAIGAVMSRKSTRIGVRVLIVRPRQCAALWACVRRLHPRQKSTCKAGDLRLGVGGGDNLHVEFR